MNLTSTCSEQLWEAMTFESWQPVTIVLEKRTTMKFVDYIDQAMDPERRPILPYLVEDEYLNGLCSMQAWVHRDSNIGRCWMPSGLPVPPRDASRPTASAWSATYWAMQLDSWGRGGNIRNRQTNRNDPLLQTPCGGHRHGISRTSHRPSRADSSMRCRSYYLSIYSLYSGVRFLHYGLKLADGVQHC